MALLDDVMEDAIKQELINKIDLDGDALRELVRETVFSKIPELDRGFLVAMVRDVIRDEIVAPDTNFLRGLVKEAVAEAASKEASKWVKNENLVAILYDKLTTYSLSDMLRTAVRSYVNEFIDIKIDVREMKE